MNYQYNIQVNSVANNGSYAKTFSFRDRGEASEFLAHLQGYGLAIRLGYAKQAIFLPPGSFFTQLSVLNNDLPGSDQNDMAELDSWVKSFGIPYK